MVNRQDLFSDEALIKAIRKGDSNAAACLYDRYIDQVHRICYRIVLDTSQVQDCVQDVWLKVFRNLGHFKCRQSFAAWLNSITANTAIDYYRKYVRQKNHIDNSKVYIRAVMDERRQDHQLDKTHVQKLMYEALSEMSVKQRTALVLRYFEDVPMDEIARTLGCTKGTVRTHIRRSLLALRAKLNGRPI